MMHPADLERFASRSLKRLPTPGAPHTLLPRVLASVQQWSRRPWYARAWFTWPLAWQFVSIALLTAIASGAFAATPFVQAAIRGASASAAAAALTNAPPVVRGLEVTMNTALVIWRALVQPLLPYVFVLVCLMCLAGATCAIALNRAVFGRARHS
jgi:hypothetical protein